MLNTVKISARILQSSIHDTGEFARSYELVYPRFIHSELMTHRMFSRNAASSRAIPIAKMIQGVNDSLAHPIHWGVNQSGMQAQEHLEGDKLKRVQEDWVRASEFACHIAKRFEIEGAHKQLSNRVLETFTHMKTIVTATEFENFYELRNHKDAQPEFEALAIAMAEADKADVPMLLGKGEFHVPYVVRNRGEDKVLRYYVGGQEVSLEDALKVSASACAQVSYRVLDLGLEKALSIYDRLVGSVPVHASPFEHQATPLVMPKRPKFGTWPKGVTHMNRDGSFGSGNFKGWIQHRHLLGNSDA